MMGDVTDYSETDYAEFTLSDGTPVRLELAPVGVGRHSGADRDTAGTGAIGGVTPVGRTGRTAQAAVHLAADGLRTVLRPLGPLLQEVHDAVSTASDPPHEVTVEFGVQIGQDLKLGLIGANGQASLKVAATWRLPEPASTPAPPDGPVLPGPASPASTAPPADPAYAPDSAGIGGTG
jgi:Trypsin-co-occurring domain 1